MKRSALLSFVACTAIGLHAADTNTMFRLNSGTAVATKDLARPECDIAYVDDGVIVTYTISEAAIAKSGTEKSSAYLWKSNGFYLNDASGQPALPSKADLFYIPKGYDVDIKLLDSEHVDYHLQLAPAPRPQSDSDSMEEAALPPEPIREYDGFFPEMPVSISDIQYWRNRQIVYVDVWPAQYDMESSTVRAYTYLSYKISYRPHSTLSVLEADDFIHPDIPFPYEDVAIPVINPVRDVSSEVKRLPSYPALTIDPAVYLIVTTTAMKEAAEKMAEWKRCLGFNTIVETRDKWTSAQVKSTVASTYAKDKNLAHLLIIGDMADVPAYPGRGKDDAATPFVTDHPYVCLDGDNDFIADLTRGRIPTSSNTQAISIIDKIIKYQYNPPTTTAYYNTVVAAAEFEDRDFKINIHDGYEDKRFVLTTEEIIAYLSKQKKSVQRVFGRTVGKTTDTIRPSHWNNNYYSNGGSLHAPLNSPSFNWASRATHLASAINKGSFLIVQRGHGCVTGWANPSFQTANLSLLTTSAPSVYLSISCQTGKFNDVDDCLAEALIRRKGGAVAVIAASENSYSGYNEAFLEGMIQTMFPGETLLPLMPSFAINSSSYKMTKTRTMGLVMNAGFAAEDCMTSTKGTKQYNKEIFHLFGDPAMEIYTERPSIYPSFWVVFNTDSITISGTVSGCTMAIYDTSTQKVKNIYASGTYKVDNPSKCVVTVHPANFPVKVYKGSDAVFKKLNLSDYAN